jgi:integrase
MARRKSGAVPQLQHHKATGQGKVHLGGRDFYCGKWDSDDCKRKYDQLIAEWLHNGRRAPVPSKRNSGRATVGAMPPSDPGTVIDADTAGTSDTGLPTTTSLLVCEIAARYMEHCESYYRDADGRLTSSFGNAKQAVIKLSPFFDVPAASFGPKRLQEMRSLLVEQGRSRKGCNKLVKEVKRLFRWAESQELVPGGTVHGLDSVEPLKRGRTTAAELPPVKPVSDAIIEATLKHLPTVVADMVRVQRLTGARSSEVCFMRPRDFDCSAEVWEYRPHRHKTDYLDDGLEKVIPIGPRAQEILAAYFDRPRDAYCFSPEESEAERRAAMRERRKSKVQPSQQNRRKKKPKRTPRDHYTRDTYRRAIQRAAEKAKVTVWTPHQIRHTTATEVRREFGIEASQTFLGHKDANVTQIYAERNLDLARKVARQLG